METALNAVTGSKLMERQRVDGSSPASKRREVRVERTDAGRVKQEPEARTVERAAERLNEALQTFNRELAISVHDDGKLVVRVTDRGTGDVIRQIPPEQVLKVEENLDKIVGLFVNDMA